MSPSLRCPGQRSSRRTHFTPPSLLQVVQAFVLCHALLTHGPDGDRQRSLTLGGSTQTRGLKGRWTLVVSDTPYRLSQRRCST